MSDHNYDDEITETDVIANPEFQRVTALMYLENRMNRPAPTEEDVTAELKSMQRERDNGNIPAQVLKQEILDDLKPTNPKDLVATTKIDLSLFPHTAVAHGALALMEGHLKYGAYNWRVGGILISVYLAALRRHIAKFENGEWADPKTGVPHLSNALACIAILLDGFEVDCIKDDRPPAHPDIGGMYDRLEEQVKHLLGVFPPENSPGRYTEQKHGEQNSTEALRDGVGSRGSISDSSGS